jgi:hypothetical protein
MAGVSLLLVIIVQLPPAYPDVRQWSRSEATPDLDSRKNAVWYISVYAAVCLDFFFSSL